MGRKAKASVSLLSRVLDKQWATVVEDVWGKSSKRARSGGPKFLVRPAGSGQVQGWHVAFGGRELRCGSLCKTDLGENLAACIGT